MNLKTNRVAIFDPVCGMRGGHNLPTIFKYANWLHENFEIKSDAYVAMNISDSNNEIINFNQIPWVYEYWIPTKNKIKAIKNRVVIKHDKYSHMLSCSMHHVTSHAKIYSHLNKVCNRGYKTIFFPGADFYSLSALHSLLQNKKVPGSVNVVLRLMGVMESATKVPNSHEVFRNLLQGISFYLGDRLHISAETEKYALSIGSMLNRSVAVTPIPTKKNGVHEEAVSRTINRDKDKIHIACLGGAREDKGYFDLFDIASAFLKNPTTEKFHFSVQTMDTENHEYDWQYQKKLGSLSNVTLHKSRLSDSELANSISNCDIVLLPYSVGTYNERGSAILFDALEFGKPIIGADGTGFADTIRTSGIGFVYTGIEDLISRVLTVDRLCDADLNKISSNQKIYQEQGLNQLKEQFCV